MANDDSASTNEDTTVTIDVAINDSDPDGDLNPASANTTCPTCATPTNGTLVNNGDGSYTLNANFDGSDSFEYEICDTQSACDTDSVKITVNPVAVPPVAPPNDDSDEPEHGDDGDGNRDQ